MHRLASAITVALLCLPATLFAAVIHVPGDYPEINAAVQAAAPGDTVLVAAGTYTDCVHPTEGPESTPACVIMQPGVSLIGAGPEATTIDAQGLGRGIYIHAVDNILIDNLRVIGADALAYGAGILVRAGASGIVVRDVVIADNLDGGIIVIDNAEVSLARVDFLNNESKQGGGLAVEEYSTAVIADCLFEGNRSPSGAGVFVRTGCTVTITGSTMRNNAIDAAYGDGGGIAVVGSHCDIDNCDILYNSTRGTGGGIAYTDGATGLVRNSRIIGNTTADPYCYGAGISCQSSSPTFRNLLVAHNAALGLGSDGGGIDIQFAPSPLIENCTLVGNSTAAGGLAGGILVQWFATPQIVNTIIAESVAGAAIACVYSGQPTVTGSNLWQNEGGDGICGIDGGCNFSADPLFCDPDDGNYRLQPDSPCAPGNHPDGSDCGQSYCGAFPAGCETSHADIPPLARVLGNAPNPFNPQTTIFFVLDAPGDAVVRIVDLRGRTLRSFVRLDAAAGIRHEVTWDGRDQSGRSLPSGIYFYRLESRGIATTQRMSLIR